MIKNSLLIDCGSSKVNDLMTIADSLGVKMGKVGLDEANLTDFTGVDALIISGGPHLFTGSEGEALRSKFDFLPAVSVPILGICLGHQALALMAGGSVYRGEEERSAAKIELLDREHGLFAGIPDSTSFGEDHCEGANAPPGFTVLARSKNYANEAMANNRTGRYGVQFHPEISGESGRRLIRNFFDLVAKK
tara:strand:+ start:9789 stop:10364 length:576 start_codon:yes stop_codon:yes gene_type:complete